MTVSLLVIIFLGFISYFAGRISSKQVNKLIKRDQVILTVFWSFIIGSIMLFLKWLQVQNAVGYDYAVVQEIWDAKRNFMQIYVGGCYAFSIIMGILFFIGFRQPKIRHV